MGRSIRYTEHLAEAEIDASVGSKGNFYDGARAESVIGLFEVDVTRQSGPWQHVEAVDFAPLD